MKTVTLYRPHTIQNALNDFDRCFESFCGDTLISPSARIFNRLPAVDIRETESAYLLDMELPGYDEKNIEVHLDGSSLSIASKQEEARKEQGIEGSQSATGTQNTYLIRERRMSAFSRSFKLPENADPETVSAEFKNGVLSMEIKKRPEAQKRSIAINVKQ